MVEAKTPAANAIVPLKMGMVSNNSTPVAMLPCVYTSVNAVRMSQTAEKRPWRPTP